MMSGNSMLRLLALVVAAFSISSVRLAAQDAPSVAEAARRAREQKRNVAKPARVITDDTLKPAPPDGTRPPGADTAAPPAPGSADATAAPSKEDSAEDGRKKKQIETLRQEIKDKQQSLELRQRELALAQDSYYSNPDHVHDKAGKDKLDSLQSDAKQQQSELGDLQAQLAELAPPAETKTPEPTKP